MVIGGKSLTHPVQDHVDEDTYQHRSKTRESVEQHQLYSLKPEAALTHERLTLGGLAMLAKTPCNNEGKEQCAERLKQEGLSKTKE